MEKCPFCAEEIQEKAIKCKHCKSDLTKADILRQEHGELVDLFIHEDSTAWRINLAYLAMNGAVLTGVITRDVFEGSGPPTNGAIVLSITGIIMNAATYFVVQRSKIHRLSRLFRAYQIEDELKNLKVPLKTFTTVERLIYHGKVLDEKGKTRDLWWYENIEALSLLWKPLFPAIFWLVFFIWLCFGRPPLMRMLMWWCH